ncbi:sugar ABC transporter substrate-binding protein [Bacillus sp. ISL-47]|uniref:ABC transporter substrate-binding protein n=1 Tax=Bacillus sp. ISL-47 TaxID=2819130 RepID=UPI001BE5F9F2|nr:sugar ABC transporter substrate-binding protein [Bacillus sp. ISL-47]MBT2689261.1 sugar ABC transporter substrate-binding protein [Bacillus sp. ISL-47]MBT2708614.1 sugar ABC transporter substrate-binding protein [Pseudomonas sp. ISL-84]
MKNVKQFACFLCLALVMSLIAGCAAPKEKASNSEEDNEKAGDTGETIEFVYWAAAGGEETAFKELIAKFESENPGIKVKASQVPSPSNGDYYPKLQTRIAADDSPDVFRVQYQKIGEFASQGALLDVTDLFSAEKDKFNSSLMTAVTFEDKIYGLPHHTDTLGVFYNKTYLDQLGIKAPEKIEDAWTWEEFLNIAKRIKDEGLAPHGVAFNWAASSAYRSLPFLHQNGSSLLTEDLKQGNLETPEAIETLTFLKDMYKNYMSEGNSMKGSEDYNMLFTSGNAGLFVTGNWMIPKFEADMKDFEWGATYMPMKESAASDLGGNGLAIPGNTKHSEAAQKFLAFMGEKENMKTFVEKGLFLPGRTDIDNFNYQLQEPEMMNVFIEQSQTVPEELAKTVTSTEFASLNAALADTLEQLFISDMTPEEAAKELNSKINSILE